GPEGFPVTLGILHSPFLSYFPPLLCDAGGLLLLDPHPWAQSGKAAHAPRRLALLPALHARGAILRRDKWGDEQHPVLSKLVPRNRGEILPGLAAARVRRLARPNVASLRRDAAAGCRICVGAPPEPSQLGPRGARFVSVPVLPHPHWVFSGPPAE